jgi:hypothetical protein
MVTSLNRTVAARDAGYQMTQYICGRHTLTGTDAPQTKIGTLPAGSVIVYIATRVVTAVTGGTPVLGIGTTSTLIGGTGNINAVIAEAAGSEILAASATVAQPLAADTDIWVGTSGGATAGDVVVTVAFVKPLS